MDAQDRSTGPDKMIAAKLRTLDPSQPDHVDWAAWLNRLLSAVRSEKVEKAFYKECSIEDCQRPARARGWCKRHYDNFLRTGDPIPKRIVIKGATLEERFWSKVDKRGPDECWNWLGAGKNQRYGFVSVYREEYGKVRNALVHRVAYELQVGPIPEGLTIDHTCRNTKCVNAAHLEPVTHQENIQRARERIKAEGGEYRMPAKDERGRFLKDTA